MKLHIIDIFNSTIKTGVKSFIICVIYLFKYDNRITKIMMGISDWYPPSKYLFYPLYKFYRRKIGLNMYVANFSTWVSSAALHAALVVPNLGYTKAVIFGGIFLGLGTLSTGAKLLERKCSNRNKTLDDVIRD